MNHKLLTAVFFILPLVLTGCIIDPTHVEEDFGNSVRQMVDAQIYDPAAASNPLADPPLVLDGPFAEVIVEGNRKAAKRPEAPSNQIIFTVR